MVNYQSGRIYKIVDNTTDKIYIGSTCEPTLARRLAKHTSSYKDFTNGGSSTYITSFEIIKNGDCDIVLVEAFPCNSKDELHSRERLYIENNICVNKKNTDLQNLILKKGDLIKIKNNVFLKNVLISQIKTSSYLSFLEIDYYTQTIILLKNPMELSIDELPLFLNIPLDLFKSQKCFKRI